MEQPRLQDAPGIVVLRLPARAKPGDAEVSSLRKHGLQAPCDAEGWTTLSDGSRLGFVCLAPPSSASSPAEALLECRRRVEQFLQSGGWKDCGLQKWPLHHRARRTELVLHALRTPKILGLLRHSFPQRLVWLQTAGRLPFLDQLYAIFGEAVAWSFAWHVSQLVCLVGIALASVIFTAIKWSDETTYQSFMPTATFFLITWCILTIESQEAVMAKLQEHWQPMRSLRSEEVTSEVSSEQSFHARTSSKRRWQESKFLACLRRNVRFELCCGPILLFEWLFIWCFFLGFFWLQLWTTFEWGGCREYNERTGTRDCMSPEFLYPVSGKVLAAVPSFAQGFAFELVSGLSKLSVDLIVSMQVWPSNEEMRCTAASYYFFLEVVGKLGFICVLGFLYVPDYGGDEMGCTGRLDFWFLGNWSFSCLKLNVPRTLRFQLFLASVKGPFLISGILGIFKKTLLPILLEKLRSLENLWWPLDYLVRCVIAVLRLLVLLLYCDWHARDAGGAASLRALLRLADDANDADAERRRALAEGRRRVFDPFEECIELLLHFLWVSCFFVVYPPLGVTEAT
ncbi:unnamed protein product [Durusdinium trenchii]|uniref:Anoctamin transmembrane domain-containing protein n=1 Tax=Durusdinium trenchii TaxID=1381693 RepID=A0ABP0J2Z6_9DINO